jgi:uncharacterized protein
LENDVQKLLKQMLAFLGLVALAAQPGSAAPQPKPALWRVSDADTTIYLFGTIHLLPRSAAWRSPRLEQALRDSQGLVVETLVDSANPRQLAAEMAALGFRSGLPPLVARVSPDKVPALRAAMARTGIPEATYNRMESWAAAFTLLGVQFQSLGLQGEAGVESVLRRTFTAAGKPVGQLETNREQLLLFDTLPEKAQRQLLEGAIEPQGAVKQQFDSMLAVWLSGDVEAIGRTFNRDLEDSPELRNALLTYRNGRWAQWIERRLAQPGTVLVAVGAGHLAGDTSVQRYLQSRGIKVRRVQ